MKTILVVEDEPTLLSTLRYNLEREGYRVLTASDGESGLDIARSCDPDALILDLMLPVMSGLDVCRIVRRDSTVPIIMLTARSEETDRVVGLEIGADDYVVKPFGMRELMARVAAVLRRSATATPPGPVFKSGNLLADATRREVSLRGEPLALKPKEYDLLVYFLRNPRRAFTRDELLDEVWGYEFAGDSRTVDVHINWLRHKIEETPSKPTRLITIRGHGYRFEG